MFKKGMRVKRRTIDYENVKEGQVYTVKAYKTLFSLPFLELKEIEGCYLAYSFDKIPTNTIKKL